MNTGSKRLSLIANHLSSGTKHSLSTNTVTASTAKKETFRSKDDYKYFLSIQTRWSDADVYGHLNNSIYYHYFDTVINDYLIKHCGLEPNRQDKKKPIGLVVASQANFYASANYPSVIHAGLRITKIGRSSVTYRVGIFEAESATACVVGGFTHVFVDPESRRPIQSLPEIYQNGMEKLL